VLIARKYASRDFLRRTGMKAVSVRWRAVVVIGIAAALAVSSTGSAAGGSGDVNQQVGTDANEAANPFVQPQDAAEAGGGVDQTLQYGDVLSGTRGADLQIGRLGTDVLFGYRGNDVLIGGLEHFNPDGRDRKFGGPGNDILIWAPGDNSDLLVGGPGQDVLVLGLVGEGNAEQPVFATNEDQQAGEVYVDPQSGLPLIEVSSAPGFCEVVDSASSADAAERFRELGIEQLVRFFVREEADSFERGEQTTDNGLRQTMHLSNVEFLICTNRDGTDMEVLNLRESPPRASSLSKLALEERLQLMLR
jgi:hypothetical protein